MAQTRNLFVYGTLRPAAEMHMGRAMRRRLSRESRLIGAAVLPGRLLDLGRYPGLVETPPAPFAEGGLSTVTGEILALDSPESTWPWLDEYEGYDPRDPKAGLYDRTIRTALSPGGTASEVWVYVLRQLPARQRYVASGDWLRR